MEPSSQKPHDEVEVVQVTRSTDPVPVSVSPEAGRRHELSKQKYPFLNLTEGEYVILDVERHPIGLISIWAVVFILVGLVTFAPVFFLTLPGIPQATNSLIMQGFVIVGLLDLLFIVGGWIFTNVFNSNRLLLTNESLIQEVQTSPFSSQEKTINLENVKDVSFIQKGIIQELLGYGAIRGTTEGDGQEYYFSLVTNPKHQADTIANVIEAVKYGRPIDEALSKM